MVRVCTSVSEPGQHGSALNTSPHPDLTSECGSGCRYCKKKLKAEISHDQKMSLNIGLNTISLHWKWHYSLFRDTASLFFTLFNLFNFLFLTSIFPWYGHFHPFFLSKLLLFIFSSLMTTAFIQPPPSPGRGDIFYKIIYALIGEFKERKKNL
jgi:hypothetical protein